MPGLIDFANPLVDAAHARYTQLKQSGMPDDQIFQMMDQEKTLVPLGQLAAKVMALKNAAQQTPMPPQNTINEQVEQQLQQMQNPQPPQQQGIGSLPEAQQAQAAQQGQPQAPQGMPPEMQQGVGALPAPNVGNPAAYAAGGIVAFAGRGPSLVQSNDDLGAGLTFSTGVDDSGNETSTAPASDYPASPFILGNQPLNKTGQTDVTSAPPTLDKGKPTLPTTPTTKKDSATSYFDAFKAHIDEEQKKLDAAKTQSVDDLMKEYSAYREKYGTGVATDMLNKRIDEMENEISAKSDEYEKLANRKKWAAVGKQASKSGQAGNALNKFLASMIAGDEAYAEAKDAGDKALEARKDKIFENRLAINKLAQEENSANLREAIAEHKNQITQQAADKKTLVSERLTLLREQADQEQKLISNRTAQAQVAAYSDPYKEVERRYIAARQAGNTKLADELYSTMQKLKAAGSGPTASKTVITALQNNAKALETQAGTLEYTNPTQAAQLRAQAKEIRDQVALMAGSLDPSGLTANTPGLSNTSVDTSGWGNLQVR